MCRYTLPVVCLCLHCHQNEAPLVNRNSLIKPNSFKILTTGKDTLLVSVHLFAYLCTSSIKKTWMDIGDIFGGNLKTIRFLSIHPEGVGPGRKLRTHSCTFEPTDSDDLSRKIIQTIKQKLGMNESISQISYNIIVLAHYHWTSKTTNSKFQFSMNFHNCGPVKYKVV